MSDQTVRQLAEIVKISLEKLLEQLKEAGLSVSAPDDVINEDEKMKLLAHLRKRHGKEEGEAASSPRRVTLERRKVTEIKQVSAPGSSTKTISVEVRKKKTYIKRELVDSEAATHQEPIQSALPASETIADVVSTTVEAVSPVVDALVPEVLDANDDVKVLETIAHEQEIPLIDNIEADVDVDSQAKFDALKDKEEKKIKQEKSNKIKETEEAKKKLDEKEHRLEESIKKNADKIRQQAAVKQETLHRKKQDEGSSRPSGKDAKRGKRRVNNLKERMYKPKVSISLRCQLQRWFMKSPYQK